MLKALAEPLLSIKMKGGYLPMESRILWEKEMEKALERARTEGKPVLLFFHNPA